MRTIAFVTQKGGAGKSTLASNIAVAAKTAGERVFVIDLDPLQSLVKWSNLRKDPDLPVEYVPALKLPKTLEMLEKKGFTLVVLDAPGQDGEAQDAAIRAADLCIVPARPNVFDLWASEITRARVKAKGKDYTFLLNQCPPAQQSQRVDQGAKALSAMGGLLTPLVSARVDYQEAARQGLGVGEWQPSGVAATEMREIWSAVKRRMRKAAQLRNEIKAAAKAEAEFVAAEATQKAAAEAQAAAKASPKRGRTAVARAAA